MINVTYQQYYFSDLEREIRSYKKGHRNERRREEMKKEDRKISGRM